MQINTINKCCKPKPGRAYVFKGESSPAPREKVRYKHYEELNDDALEVQSIVKAYRDVNHSGKMKLFKAMPAITLGLTSIGIGLTRPGKLSEKTASGLGFLVTLKVVDAICNGINKANEDDVSENPSSNKHVLGYLGKILALATGAAGLGALLSTNKASGFIADEVSKLSKELNCTRLAKFSNKNIEPFIKKHPKLNMIAGLILPLGTLISGTALQAGLERNISCEIRQKAADNFQKSKEVQKIAKTDYDEIDAQEV